MMQRSVINEPDNLSWARSLILATGIFFVAVIYLGQIPSYFELASTQATLATLEQGLSDMGLLALGLALVGMTIAFLYDPKPVSNALVGLFGLIGMAFTGSGLALMFFVYTGVFHKYLPDQIVSVTGSGTTLHTTIVNWPNPAQSYLFNTTWFQSGSMDLSGLGFIAFVIGFSILGFVALYPLHSSGRLVGSTRSLLVQVSSVSGMALLFAYLTLYTFSRNATTNTVGSGAIENIILTVAFCLMLFALQAWLLPVMTAPKNIQRFMPANYLHASMLLGNVAVPLLALFAAVYPIMNFLATTLPTDNWFVQCATKDIPSSCTFTANMGYVVAAIVSSMFMTFIIAAGYLWNRKPAFARLGFVYAFIFAAIAAPSLHTVSPTQMPVAISFGIGIIILGFIWMVSTQREFVPAEVDARPLGCTGQWLILGTGLFIYLAGFGFFSYAQFFDTEQNLIVSQGKNTIHDAYWFMLIFGIAAAIQFAFLTRRQSIGTLRKVTLWFVILGAILQIVSSIGPQLHTTSTVPLAFYGGIALEVVGILVGLWSAFQTRTQNGIPFAILSLATAFIGIVSALLWYSMSFDELVYASTIFMGLGAIVYSIFGADAPDVFIDRMMNRQSTQNALPVK